MCKQRVNDNRKCRRIAGDFDCHGDAAVQCGVHHPMKHILGFTRSGCRHRASACIALLRRPPWLMILGRKHKTHAACRFDEQSRGSVLCLLNASFKKRFHNATTRFFTLNDHGICWGNTEQILARLWRPVASRVA